MRESQSGHARPDLNPSTTAKSHTALGQGVGADLQATKFFPESHHLPAPPIWPINLGLHNALAGHLPPQPAIGENRLKSTGYVFVVRRGEVERGISAGLRQRGRTRGDYRCAGGHGLEHRNPEAFRKGWKQKSSRAPVEISQLVSRDKRHKAD